MDANSRVFSQIWSKVSTNIPISILSVYFECLKMLFPRLLLFVQAVICLILSVLIYTISKCGIKKGAVTFNQQLVPFTALHRGQSIKRSGQCLRILHDFEKHTLHHPLFCNICVKKKCHYLFLFHTSVFVYFIHVFLFNFKIRDFCI